ncbi:phage repressor protein/antirepressor Ant, partial [Bacillus thuringiensis]
FVRTNGQGEFVTSFTTKVTGKGQLYFINKFLGKEAM